MKTRMFSSAVLIAFLLAACATQYGHNALTGGYSDDRIDDATYRVSFDGNGYATKDRVWYFWIYRCAELTKQKGFDAFTLQVEPKTSRLEDRPDIRFVDRFADRHGALQAAAFRPGSRAALVKVKGGGAPTYTYIPGATITTWHSKAVVSMYHLPLSFHLATEAYFLADRILADLHDYVSTDGKATPPLREDVLRHALAFAPVVTKPAPAPLTIPKLTLPVPAWQQKH